MYHSEWICAGRASDGLCVHQQLVCFSLKQRVYTVYSRIRPDTVKLTGTKLAHQARAAVVRGIL
jgi:hypothetical protein